MRDCSRRFLGIAALLLVLVAGAVVQAAVSATSIAAGNYADTVARAIYPASPTSWTPSANTLYLLVTLCSDGVDFDTAPSVTDSTGLTWVAVDQSLFAVVTSPGRTMGLFVWRAMKASGLASGTTQVDFSADNQTGCAGLIIEFTGTLTTGTDGADAVVQFASNEADATANPSASLSAFADAGNGAFMVVGANTQTAATPEMGWTAIGSDPDFATPASGITAAWRSDNDTSPSFTLTSSDWGMVALEVAAAPTGGGVVGRMLTLGAGE